MKIINNLDALELDFLTELLGYPLESFQLIPINSHNSIAARIELQYLEQSTKNRPKSLFIKLKQASEGLQEYRFYQKARAGDYPYCYRNLYDALTGNSLLILEDLSQDYQSPVSVSDLIDLKALPGQSAILMIIDALAKLHRDHWEQKSDWEIPPFFHSAAAYTKRMQKYRDDWANFQQQGHDIPQVWRDIYESNLAYLPACWESYFAPRFDTHRHLTLIHGDCYLSQFLVSTEKAYMADFDSVAFSIPSDDLIFLMATFWTREQRAVYELPMLKHYLASLERDDYDWEALKADYQMMLCFRIFHVLWDAVNGSSERYWRNKMTCLIQAYEDWHEISL